MTASSETVPDQSGRVAVVTGATSGLGLEVTHALAGAGATVVLAARNAAKADSVMGQLRSDGPAADLEFRQLDTSSLSSARAFARSWADSGRRIDMLVLNAGIANVRDRQVTAEGNEVQFATNYLGHFALAALLLPWMAQSTTSRIVPVASNGAAHTELDLDDIQAQRDYSGMLAYRRSKLMMLMFGLTLDRKLRAAADPVQSIPVHPGLARTGIVRMGGDHQVPWQGRVVEVLGRIIGQPAASGARSIVYAATSDAAVGGRYYGPSGPFELRGSPTAVKIPPHAADPLAAGRLWALSEQLGGVTWPLP